MTQTTVYSREHIRTISQYGFYLLFLSAPLLNIFRFDILDGHFIVFGHSWMLGLESSEFECLDTSHSVRNVLLNFLLPVFILILITGLIAWKFGRVYCGWLCPHFSVVETINRSMLKYLNRVTFWEKPSFKSRQALPWLFVLSICILIAFIWSFILLGYIYPPRLLSSHLYHLELSFGPSLFLLVMTIILTIDFFFARHLFCQYGCSFGIMQSFVWMANSKSMVIGFDKSRAHLCHSCDSKCDKACPMRLPVRGIKRAKFTCTQCGICLTACDDSLSDNPEGRVIHWVSNTEASAVDRQAASFAIKRLNKSK
ncbi:MAG: 4Fe-4S binding protein [gamma proteobacterium symbiont of Bathyaustriella thionipta]|nr:4Fe-4S binding protein [gamma proteobacterium symbiont of Bathyaustriella thionipta]MCU7951302.1 4Fe-4S binding protein [gamma proteobacterium symbiont of Bathyaustriella thionipta]MCU7952838.1 4Fe-4S binding protein [gamma proteobacterium symbiont of Bathyaustriella thionipta]MCU7957858.1 4Fe-4S binding protein [gamma proteobacterium symbiont of Bathyaustriella thionipta]MCU7967341.1 4Fe-4S binding protein [gamma proteobacterium symbiont of Bathyaustriella thionipta]